MSCSGCRVLRKGCSETCILRPCLQWIGSAEAQGHATVFVAKFFGRAGLMSFISAVPELNRPALFQSLLFEACGRTVNPVNGAVGMLWAGNWQVCQAAVETVLRGGALRPISDLIESNQNHHCRRFSASRSKTEMKESPAKRLKFNRFGSDLDLPLNHGLALTAPVVPASFLPPTPFCKAMSGDRPGSPSEESVTTSCLENGIRCDKYKTNQKDYKLLNLFV